MDAHTFGSHISEVRDRELSLRESWFTRFGDEGNQAGYFQLWTVVTLDNLTADDLMWALVAAALDPLVTHLILYVFPAVCRNPKNKIDALIAELTGQGFSPFDFDWHLQESDGDQILIFSVFSEEEAYRIQDLYYAS